jgi:hypothetical protein
VPGKAWQGPREIRNLRWVGGNYARRPTSDSTLGPSAHPKVFNDAILSAARKEIV